MAGRPSGALERSLDALTIGMAMDQHHRRLALADTRQGHHEQMVHLHIVGEATTAAGYADCDVSWELPFLYAPQQCQVPFKVPHFTYGFEETIPTSDVIFYTAHVIKWAQNDRSWITGAIVRIGAQAPNAATPIPYAATAHLSFLGYSTMAEGDEFIT